MQRRSYAKPELMMHGTVADLTGALPTPGGPDGIPGFFIGSIPSDRAVKAAVAGVDPDALLAQLRTLTSLADAFRVGESRAHVMPVDANGVTLATLQALAEQVDSQAAEIAALRSLLQDMKRQPEA